MSTIVEDLPVAQETEVVAKAKRRRFTAAEKLRVLRTADGCTESGELVRSCGARACTPRTWPLGAKHIDAANWPARPHDCADRRRRRWTRAKSGSQSSSVRAGS